MEWRNDDPGFVETGRVVHTIEYAKGRKDGWNAALRAVRDALLEVAEDPLAGVVDFREVVTNQVVSGWFKEGGRFEVKDKT